jgi:hypothetical protein
MSTMVVSADGLHVDGDHVRLLPASLNELLVGALALGISELWLHGSVLERFRIRRGLRPMAEALGAESGWQFPDPQRVISWCRVWKSRGGGVNVHCPDLDRSSPFAGLATGGALARAAEAWDEAMPIAWRGSGAVTSDSLLRHTRKRIKEVLVPDLYRHEGRGRELAAGWWIDPTLICTTENPAVWHLDVRAAYLTAAEAISGPVDGPPEYIDDPALCRSMVGKNLPGWWVLPHFQWNYRSLPAMWAEAHYQSKIGGGPVVTTPTAAYLLKECGVSPDGGFCWDRHGRPLERWAHEIRNALDPGHPAARAAVKRTYQEGIGRLASDRRTRISDPLYQPYLQNAVVAEARTRIHRTASRIVAAGGTILAIDTDSIWLQSGPLWNTPPTDGDAHPLIPMGTTPGKMRLVGTVALDDIIQIIQINQSVIDNIRNLDRRSANG